MFVLNSHKNFSANLNLIQKHDVSHLIASKTGKTPLCFTDKLLRNRDNQYIDYVFYMTFLTISYLTNSFYLAKKTETHRFSYECELINIGMREASRCIFVVILFHIKLYQIKIQKELLNFGIYLEISYSNFYQSECK